SLGDAPILTPRLSPWARAWQTANPRRLSTPIDHWLADTTALSNGLRSGNGGGVHRFGPCQVSARDHTHGTVAPRTVICNHRSRGRIRIAGSTADSSHAL